MQKNFKLLTPLVWFSGFPSVEIIWGSVIWNLLYDDFSQNGGHFSIFCTMANAKLSFMLRVGKTETQTLGGSVIWNFTVGHFFVKWGPFYPSSFMCDGFLHLKVQNGECKFSVGSVFQSSCHYILGLVSIFKHGNT